MVSLARVRIWGAPVGAVAWEERKRIATFEFEPAFLKSGLELSPINMPLTSRQRLFAFPALPLETFKGLP